MIGECLGDPQRPQGVDVEDLFPSFVINIAGFLVLLAENSGGVSQNIASLTKSAFARTMLDGSVTSIRKIVTEPARASSRRSAATSGFRQAAKIRQPSAAYWRANSKPRPRLAPVIMIAGMHSS
jgi:hypothetical protein